MPANDTPSITISLGENLAAKAKIQVAGGAPANLNAGSGAFEPFETLTSVDELIHSETETWNSGGTAGILPMERAKASFDGETMTNFIDGGKKETFRRRWIASSTEGLDDAGGSSEKYDLERSGKGGAVAENFKHFMEIHKEYLDQMYVPKGNEMMYMQMNATMAGYPGFGLFLLTVTGQGSMEQLGWWLDKTYKMKITGAYAQTELGHGSNVRGLRTTATFDKATQEFVLDTPTLGATKWWPSSMATATHAVVYAQLIIDNCEYGVHVFWLQLRDENLEPLPGIEVGDIGTKMGENEVDIGYLRMKNVRIPRKHMMEKKSHVSPEGVYMKHDGKKKGGGEDKSHYLTMMGARVTMVSGASAYLAKAATIAIRYNAVRTQGFKDTSAGVSFLSREAQIIDYKMNQYRLLKELALCYATRFTSNWLTQRMDYLRANLEDAGDDLPEIHASAAGLKGFCCNATAVGIEELRKCCGGAGYLQASGIAPLEQDYKWRATAEGDTVVMLLQTARYLVKSADTARQGNVDQLSGLTACLASFADPNFNPLDMKHRPPSVNTVEEMCELPHLLQLFEYRARTQVYYLATSMWDSMAKGSSFDESWTQLTLKACRTGQSHVLYFMLSKFIDMVGQCQDAACKAVITNVCALFALSDIIGGQQWAGLLDMDQIELAEKATNAMCSAIRPEAVALVDAWDFPDRALNSTIGGFDGDVYEKQYKAAVHSPLNARKVPEFFEVIKEHLDLGFLSQRNGTDPDYEGADDDDYPSSTPVTGIPLAASRARL